MNATKKEMKFYREERDGNWLCLEKANKIKPVVKHHVHLGKEILHILNTAAFLLLRVLRAAASNLDVKFMHGSEKYGGKPIRACYVGDGSNFDYMLKLLFKKMPDIVRAHKIRWWTLGTVTKKISSSVDLVVLDVDFPISLTVDRQDILKVPRWVRQRIPIADTWEKILAGLRRKTRKEAFRLIRKFQFKARVISTRESAEFFYERLYRPHIFERFGESATVVSRERFIKECRHAQIIHLIHRDKVLGGVVVRLSKKQLSIVWVGMDKGLDDDEFRGTADALDLFTLFYAYNQGCRFLDMGGSRAHLNDGVLRYKKKWGAMIYPSKVPQGNLFIIPVTSSSATASILENNQWITSENGTMTGNIFLPEKFNPNELEEILQHHWIEGLEKMRFFVNGQVPERFEFDQNTVAIVPCPYRCPSQKTGIRFTVK